MSRLRLFGGGKGGGPKLHGPNRLISQIIMIMFLLGFWAYVWGLERVTYTVDQQPWLWMQIDPIHAALWVLYRVDTRASILGQLLGLAPFCAGTCWLLVGPESSCGDVVDFLRYA